jgi:nicotinamide-nucleotide amidase
VAADELRRLAERLQAASLRGRATVATAESCTGGLLADAVTDVPGSSDYFRGGVVAYSNEAKAALLGVAADAMAAHGAVSAQVAQAMARGARERFGADVAVAVTGVAGPGGATPSKPVGLTYVAVATAGGVVARRFTWSGDRLANKESSARAALEMLLAAVEELGADRPGAAAEPAAGSAEGAEGAAAAGARGDAGAKGDAARGVS